MFDRWIIVHADYPQMAWTGLRWAPITPEGMPAGQFQVCNFATYTDAEVYAQGAGMEVLPVGGWRG